MGDTVGEGFAARAGANVTLTSVRGRNYVCEAEQCPLPATWELRYDSDDPECSVGYEFCCAADLPAAHHSEALLLTEARATTAEQAAAAALTESARQRGLLGEAQAHLLDHLDCLRGTPLADNVDATLCGISIALAQTGAE